MDGTPRRAQNALGALRGASIRSQPSGVIQIMLMNLVVGIPTMLLCLLVQTATTFWSVRHYVRQSEPPGSRSGFVASTRPLLSGMLIMMAGNLLQIALWGVLFVWLDEFGDYYEAVYHSAVNFASLGYGDVIMGQRWKLLGPLEAVNGVLMLGMTAAALMAILQELIRAQRRALDLGRQSQ